MHFTNAKRQPVKLIAGCKVCRDPATGLIRYFSEDGAQLEFVKDAKTDPMLAGQASDPQTFHTRALTAARAARPIMGIEPDGANAFKFVRN